MVISLLCDCCRVWPCARTIEHGLDGSPVGQASAGSPRGQRPAFAGSADLLVSIVTCCCSKYESADVLRWMRRQAARVEEYVIDLEQIGGTHI